MPIHFYKLYFCQIFQLSLTQKRNCLTATTRLKYSGFGIYHCDMCLHLRLCVLVQLLRRFTSSESQCRNRNFKISIQFVNTIHYQLLYHLDLRRNIKVIIFLDINHVSLYILCSYKQILIRFQDSFTVISNIRTHTYSYFESSVEEKREFNLQGHGF